MSRIIKILDYVEGRPEIVISFILALVLIAFGLYIGGPWYIADSSSVFGSEIHPEVLRVFTAAFYLIPSSVNLFGLIKSKRKWRAIGSFGMFLAYLFACIIRILTIGFTPAIWLFPLGFALVSGVLYITDSRKKVGKP